MYLKIINSKNYKNLREIEQWRLSLLYFGYRWRTKRRKEETNDEKEKKNENVEKNKDHTVVGDYINTMKTTSISILIYIKLLNSINTPKHGNEEKLSIKKLLLNYS